jgi:hypothetical protein
MDREEGVDGGLAAVGQLDRPEQSRQQRQCGQVEVPQ